MRSIYIIENPLMDYVMHESYDWLAAFGAKAGTMQLVEHELFLRIVSASKEHHVIPGGSGSNTARGLAMLYGPSGEEGPRARIAYSGGIGADRPGQEFASVLESLGIETRLALKEGHTGVSAIVVTPDHERTMFTSLGACRDYSAGDLRLDLLRECRYFYSTGYMWDTAPQERALKRAVEEARAYGVRVCFDLADPFVVDRYSERLVRWISGKVDVLFANRRELSRMTGRDGPDEEIASHAATRPAPATPSPRASSTASWRSGASSSAAASATASRAASSRWTGSNSSASTGRRFSRSYSFQGKIIPFSVRLPTSSLSSSRMSIQGTLRRSAPGFASVQSYFRSKKRRATSRASAIPAGPGRRKARGKETTRVAVL
jgi:sugar/nucleoside kinase (ribokinase family)